jgi:Calpain family cysteine protease
MSEKVTERQNSQEGSHEGPAGHPLDLCADAAPALSLTRPGDSAPAMPATGLRTMAPPPMQLADKAPGGLPMRLKLGIEALAGVSMDDVHVHYGSSEPARYAAHAFARNGEIHLASGHEDKLPHEAWHIAQQRLGQVSATVFWDEQGMNEDLGLEAQAERMGQVAAAHAPTSPADAKGPALPAGQDVNVVQCVPSDFALHQILDVPGLGKKKSHWNELKQAILNYSQLLPGDAAGRQRDLELVQQATKAWREEVGFVGIDPTTLPQKRQNQGVNLVSFERRLMREWQEVLTLGGQPATSTGTLDSDQGMVPVEDPLLTRKVKTKTTFIGFFLPAAQLVKADNSPIAAPIPGTGCQLLADGSCPDGMSSMDYYKVQEYDPIDQIGTKAKIKNGYFKKDPVWVLRTQVQASHMTRPNQGMEMQDRSDPVQYPLFAHAPSQEDVEQNSLGDCWLMAAMAAVADKTPQHFSNMMKDNMDGTVTVQLYDVAPGLGFTPRRITVKKSIVVHAGTNQAGHGGGALWVSIYEKAFTAAGYHGGGDDRLPVERGSYGTIESGQSKFALKHILGRDAQSGDIQADQPEFVSGSIFHLIDQTIDPMDNQLVRTLRPQAGLTLDVNQVWDLGNSRGASCDAWQECFDPEQPRREDLVRHRAAILAATEDHLQADMATFLDWVRDYVLPGKRGTGVYAPWQMSAFQSICQRIDAGTPTTISSNDTVVSRGKNNGLAGENVGKGLVGPHAYVVLDYAPKPQPLIPQQGQLYWLKIRNPWGDVKARSPHAPSPGRVYENKDWEMDLQAPFDQMEQDVEGQTERMGAKGGDNPEFWLELNDVTKRFHRFDFVV